MNTFREYKQKISELKIPVVMYSEYCKKHRAKGRKCNDCEHEEGCAKMVELGLQQLHKIADVMGKEEFLRFWNRHK